MEFHLIYCQFLTLSFNYWFRYWEEKKKIKEKEQLSKHLGKHLASPFSRLNFSPTSLLPPYQVSACFAKPCSVMLGSTEGQGQCIEVYFCCPLLLIGFPPLLLASYHSSALVWDPSWTPIPLGGSLPQCGGVYLQQCFVPETTLVPWILRPNTYNSWLCLGNFWGAVTISIS